MNFKLYNTYIIFTLIRFVFDYCVHVYHSSSCMEIHDEILKHLFLMNIHNIQKYMKKIKEEINNKYLVIKSLNMLLLNVVKNKLPICSNSIILILSMFFRVIN